MENPIVLTERAVFEHIPPKAHDLHKGSAGKLLLVAGSLSYRGAAVLALSGALRCGCGYVTLASTARVCETAAHHWITPTFCVLEENGNGRICLENAARLTEMLKGYDALLLGCGLGLDDDTRGLVQMLLERFPGPVLLDADGINAMQGRIDMLQGMSGRIVLTPHEGELARLLGREQAWIHANRQEAARETARRSGADVVLKGPASCIASPCGMLMENHTGNSGLAKAGSGDVLSGMIASFLSQGIEPYWSAACGVYLHGAAADLAAERLSKFCMQPVDLPDYLPEIFIRNGR